jgi:hypothetical protein
MLANPFSSFKFTSDILTKHLAPAGQFLSVAGPSCCPDHSSNSKRDFKRRASLSCDSVLNEVRPTGKISLKNSTTASASTKAPTLQRRYTHPITKIDLKEPDVIRRRPSHISPSDSAIAMHPKDTVVFTVVETAIVMENIMKEYTLLAEVVPSLRFQHMRLVLGRSTRRSRHT